MMQYTLYIGSYNKVYAYKLEAYSLGNYGVWYWIPMNRGLLIREKFLDVWVELITKVKIGSDILLL